MNLALPILLSIRSPGAVALVTGGAAILGAVVGGAATGIATYKIEGARQAFERRQSLRAEFRDRARTMAAVSGAARVMAMQIENLRLLIETWLVDDPQEWWTDDEEKHFPEVSIAIEDQKLIAAELTVADWNVVTGAILLIRVFSGAREYDRQQDGSFAAPAEDTVRQAREANDVYRSAVKALLDLADRPITMPDWARRED